MRIPLELPPGLFADDTTFAASGRWADCDNVSFRLGKPQLRGGWESLISTALGGVCRAAFPWTDGNGVLNIGFGTHETLELFQGGSLFDITPTLKFPPKTLTSAYTVADGSATVTVHHPSHGLEDGDTVVLSGGTYVGRIKPDGTEVITYVDADSYTITHGSNADLTATLGSNPLSVTSGSPTVTVTETAHNFETGDQVTIAGATAVGGITPNGGPFTITKVDANTYTYSFTAAAGSTATGGGSSVTVTVPATGGTVTVAPQNAFEAGQIDGTGSVGYGTGGYGVGGYGSPSDAEYFPRTWSLSAWGENLIANPRGGTIYEWDADDTEAEAAPLANAPRQVSYALVTPTRQVMAFGCNLEVSGVFNPLCIRVSDVEDNTDWTTRSDNLAEEITVPGGGRLVAGRVIGPYVLAWTDHSLFLGTFTGTSWRFDQIGRNCGLIGPGAAVIFGQTAFWISPDRQFWSYSLGGAPQPIDCPIRSDFAENLAASQADKIVASTVAEFGEVRWDYPDARDGFENSRYIVLQVTGSDAGAWSRGVMARTAMVDAGPSLYPCGVTYDGAIYWHERGQSADGAALSGYIETCDLFLSPDAVAMLRAIYPDVKGQVGALTITDTYRFDPQADSYSETTAAIAPGQSKADIRVTGRLHRLRFGVNSSPADFRLGTPILDVAVGGGR